MISGLVQFHSALDDLLVPIDDIKPHPSNPNNGDVEAIMESIQVNGYIAPIIAQKSTGEIIAGNHRYFALKQLGSELAPVLFIDTDDVAALRYLLADNRIAALSIMDNGQLVELLEQLEAEDSLLGTGYNQMDLENLKALEDITPDYTDHASWPTISLTVPPHIKNAFYEVTEHAVSDHDRMESLLRMAGWRPKGEQE